MSVPTQNTDPRQELDRSINDELLSALASLGLSEETTFELTSRIFVATEASPAECYRVIAGLKLLSEVISVEEVPTESEVVRIDVPTSRKPLEVVHDIKKPAVAESATDKEGQLNPNVKSLIRLLTKSDDDLDLDPELARNHLDQLVEKYLSNRKTYGNSKEEFRNRIGIYMDGSSISQVAEMTGTTEGALHQNVYKFIKTVHQRVGGPEDIRALLLGGELALEQKLPLPEVAVVEELTPQPEPTPEAEPESLEDRLEALLAPVWGKPALASLRAIFEDKLQDDDMLARSHISNLLAIHAPRRGSGNTLAVIEWDVLSHMAGYHLPSGNKLPTYSNLVIRFRNSCEQRRTDVETVIFDGLQKLVEQDSNPDTSEDKAERAVLPAPVAEAPKPIEPEAVAIAKSEVSDQDMYKLPRQFRELIKDTSLTHEQQVQLALHFGFEFEGRNTELNPKLRDFAVIQMRERVQGVLKTSSIRAAQGQTGNRCLNSLQTNLLAALCPAANNGTPARTYKELEPIVMRQTRMSAEQVKTSFLAGLETAAAIYAGRTEYASKSRQNPRRRR